jgi:molecular chaperone HscB
MQQMELREALEEAVEAKDAASLDALQTNLIREKQSLEDRIGEHIDARKDYPGAAKLVRKLMFLDKLGEEIDLAYEAAE